MTKADKLGQVRDAIRAIPDFPKPGILFRDITPLLGDPAAFHACLDLLCEPWKGQAIDRIVGLDARGFLFGAAMADRLSIGFAPVRKKGKLPAQTVSVTYDLEYGTDTVEMHRDAFEAGARVLVVDDLLATGGTVTATTKLVERMGGDIVGVGFLIELDFLKGRERISQYDVKSLVHYDSE